MCGKRLNAWKTIPIPRSHLVHVHARRRDVVAVDDDASLVDRLEQVDAAKERGLAGARRADQADDLVLVDGEVDAAQHLDLAEGLVDVLDAQRGAHASASRRRRRRLGRGRRGGPSTE